MKKISAFEIIGEAFSLLFGNLKYLLKKLWFVNTLFLISGIMLFIFGAYDGLVAEWINQKYFHGEDFWYSLIYFGFIIPSIVIMLITNLNIVGYLVEFGMTKNINRLGLKGLRFGNTELKIAGVMVMALGISGFFAAIPFFISLIFIKGNFLDFGVPLMVFAWICFIGINQRFSLAIPIAVMEKDNIGLGDSWNKTKGYWKTIIGLCLYLYISIKVGNILETQLEQPSAEIDFSNNLWIYGLILKALFCSIYLYLSTIILILIPVVFYKRIKGIK